MSCNVVCISHATGAGGAEVGRLVAERLGYLYVDEDIVAAAAAHGGLEPREVADAERRKSRAARILEALEGGGGALVIGGAVPYPTATEQDAEEIRALLRETIEQTAARGRVVIVAHAASQALERRPDVLRVLVTASPAIRAGRVREAGGLDEAQATRVVKDADAGRRDYLKRFYKIDQELPTHYDVVANTDVLTVEQAAEIVARAAAG